MRLLERQEFKCALTGRKLTPEDCSLDHIVPVSQGGNHTLDNVQLVCVEANMAKGTLSMQRFISLCRDVLRHQGDTADTPLQSGSDMVQSAYHP